MSNNVLLFLLMVRRIRMALQEPCALAQLGREGTIAGIAGMHYIKKTQ